MKPVTDSDRDNLIEMIEGVLSKIDEEALFTETEISLQLVLLVLKGATFEEACVILDDCMEKAKEAEQEQDDHYSGTC